jgi:hypothetical protein
LASFDKVCGLDETKQTSAMFEYSTAIIAFFILTFQEEPKYNQVS